MVTCSKHLAACAQSSGLQGYQSLTLLHLTMAGSLRCSSPHSVYFLSGKHVSGCRVLRHSNKKCLWLLNPAGLRQGPSCSEFWKWASGEWLAGSRSPHNLLEWIYFICVLTLSSTQCSSTPMFTSPDVPHLTSHQLL